MRGVPVIRWATVPGKLTGFTFLPLWEVGFGWFLMVVACTVPLLFFWFNGLHMKQYLEWGFCLVFLVFFLFLGWNLGNQRFLATIEDGRLTVSHNLREPPFSGSWPVGDWMRTEETPVQGKDQEPRFRLTLTIGSAPVHVYESINQNEIRSLVQAFDEMKRSMP